MRYLLFFFFFTLLFQHCTQNTNDQLPVKGNIYAHGFSIEYHDSYRRISISDPWQGANSVNFEYLTAGESRFVPDSLRHLPFIKTPVNNVVVFSTTHIGFIDVLGKADRVVGVSGLEYVCNSVIRNRKNSGLVSSVGVAPEVNYEKILMLEPDLVLLYGLESSVTGIQSRLQNMNIPVILVSEYLELHPLGRLEWIRLFGTLFKEEERAEDYFERVVEQYDSLKTRAEMISEKPSVLVGLPWKDTWYVSGGKSFMANLIEDAGGNYLWKSDNSRDFIPLSMETVITKAMEAEIWINSGSATSLSEILARDKRYENLKALKNGQVYNNDLQKCTGEGNAFWETGVVEPHLILKDLIKIFNPDSMQSHDFVYYRKLE